MILVNGKQQNHISVNDRGFLYGDGLFETILVKNSRACFLEEHLQRLFISCARLKIKPPARELLLKETKSLIQDVGKGVLKIIITRGEADGGLRITNSKSNRVLQVLPYPKRIETNINKGIKLKICKTQLSSNPATSGMKLLNWLEPVLANLELGNKYQEGLMLDTKENIIEGTVSNFYCVKDKNILTPDLEGCGLPGIMRDNILKEAARLGFNINTGKIKIKDLSDFDEFFTSNSLSICPVRQINNKKYEKTCAAKTFSEDLL